MGFDNFTYLCEHHPDKIEEVFIIPGVSLWSFPPSLLPTWGSLVWSFSPDWFPVPAVTGGGVFFFFCQAAVVWMMFCCLVQAGAEIRTLLPVTESCPWRCRAWELLCLDTGFLFSWIHTQVWAVRLQWQQRYDFTGKCQFPGGSVVTSSKVTCSLCWYLASVWQWLFFCTGDIVESRPWLYFSIL